MTDLKLYPKPLFSLLEPEAKRVPIILHLPHSGTFIPESIALKLVPKKKNELDETDWYLDQLYDFCNEMGVLMVKANYHRWVADLNRNPENIPLYDDGRVITSVIPEVDFNGEALYTSSLSKEEIQGRIDQYHHPYFREFKLLIRDYLNNYGKLLIWDGHSIRRHVPGIQESPFPDLILGTNSRSTFPDKWHDSVRNILENSPFTCTYDTPFKGGYITRSLADKKQKIYTVQMEMSKDLYMDSTETKYNEDKAALVRTLFKNIFSTLIDHVCQD